MIGVAAVYQLLAADSAVTALVPEERIVTGILPQGVDLEAISITDVSGVDFETIAPGDNRFTTDRVQVTVLARNYEKLFAVIKAVKSACDAKTPTVDGIDRVVVRTDGQGPYFTNEAASIHMKSQDFRVSYNQLA